MTDIVNQMNMYDAALRAAAAECDALKAKLAVYEAALVRIADRNAWAEKYPTGAYQCIAVEAIGIAREALANDR